IPQHHAIKSGSASQISQTPDQNSPSCVAITPATPAQARADLLSDRGVTERHVSSATTAADVRFSTLSLLKMCPTCLQMVPVFAPTMMPISWLLLPCEIQNSTSASRGVNLSDAKASTLR